MKKWFTFLLVVCLLVSFSGCAAQTPDVNHQARAYLAVFDAFWYDASCTVVDLSETKISDKEAVYALMEDYCRQRNARFMRYEDYTGSDIDPYAETVLLSFYDSRLTKTKLVTEVSKLWPNYHNEGFGTRMVVKYRNGTWIAEDIGTTWIT